MRFVCRASVVALMLALGAVRVAAQADKQGCFNGAAPYNDLPSMDGELRVERGWFGALRLNLNDNIGIPRTAFVDMVQHGAFMYIGIFVDEPETTFVDDTIVLGIAHNTTGAQGWKIFIKPWDASGEPTCSSHPCTKGTPFEVKHWRGGHPAWNSNAETPISSTNWLNSANWDPNNSAKPAFVESKNGNSWSMVIRIPVQTQSSLAGNDDKVYFPQASPNTFQFYVNILSTAILTVNPTTHVNNYKQATWPQVVTIVPPAGGGFLDQLMPDPAAWGTVSLFQRTDCTGVDITTSDVGIRYTTNVSDPLNSSPRYGAAPAGGWPADCTSLDNTSRFGPANYLVARPRNTMATDARVSVLYGIADFGIPNVTRFLPVTVGLAANQTDPIPENDPRNPVPHGGSAEFVLDWALTQRQSCEYAHSPGRCSRVVLDSTDSTVRFNHRDAMLNLYFVHASRAEVDAAISGEGYGPPPAGRTAHRFFLDTAHEIQQFRKAGATVYEAKDRTGTNSLGALLRIAQNAFPRGLDVALTERIRGYRATGRYLVMDRRNGTKYEYAEYVGGYGIVAGHKGAVKAFTHDFDPSGVQKTQGPLTAAFVDVDPGRVARVKSVIVATPGGCFPTTPQALLVLSVAMSGVGVLAHRPRRRRRNRG